METLRFRFESFRIRIIDVVMLQMSFYSSYSCSYYCSQISKLLINGTDDTRFIKRSTTSMLDTSHISSGYFVCRLFVGLLSNPPLFMIPLLISHSFDQ